MAFTRKLPILDRRRLRYLALIGSLALFAAVIWAIGPNEVVQATREADPRLVGVAAALYGISLFVRVIKWRLLIKPLEGPADGGTLAEEAGSEDATVADEVDDGAADEATDEADGETGIRTGGTAPGRVGLGRLSLIYLAGSFLDATTPGARVGGEPLKAYYLGQMLERPKSECLATVVVEKVTNLAVLGLIAMVSLVFVLVLVELRLRLWLTLALLLALVSAGYLVAFVVWLGHRRRRSRVPSDGESTDDGAPADEPPHASSLLSRILTHLWNWGPAHRRLESRFPSASALEEHVHQRISNFTSSMRVVSHRRELVAANLLLAAVMWLAVFGRTYALFVGFSSDIYSILLSYLAFTPGGLGVTEVVLLTLYVAFGVERSIAAAVAVLDRLIYYGFGIGLGYWALRRLEKGMGGVREAELASEGSG